MNKWLSLFLLLCVFILGCEQDKYQMVKGEDGKTYRLNKRTGEMAVIKDSEIVPLETPESRKNRQILEQTLENPIDWGETNISGKNLNVKLRTSWREGSLYYQFTVFPYSSLESIYNKREKEPLSYGFGYGFTINLLDKNGFVIIKIPINLWSISKTVDNTGEPTGLLMDSNIELSKGNYEAIAYYSPGWVLDMESIPSADKTVTSLPISELSLDGIIFDPKGHSLAVINGIVHKEGDVIEGYLLKEINELSVILQKDGKTTEIILKVEQ